MKRASSVCNWAQALRARRGIKVCIILLTPCTGLGKVAGVILDIAQGVHYDANLSWPDSSICHKLCLEPAENGDT